jgi:hypothetical protein
MDSISLPSLLEKYTLLSSNEFPQDSDEQKSMAIAEGIRLALYYNRDVDGKITPTNPLHLRNWVFRKLRSVIPELRNDEDRIITDMVSNMLTPNLEFLGDVIRLGDGYFLPGPTRVVPISEGRWNLISGIPTREFVTRGMKIDFIGPVRRIGATSSVPHNMFQQCLDSYLELDSYDSNKSHIQCLMEVGQQMNWSPTKTFEGYSGFAPKGQNRNDKKGPFGFKNWGNNPIELSVHGKLVSLWREEPTHGQYNYWLKVKQKLDHTTINEVVDHGQRVKVLKDYDLKIIKVPTELFRLVALEFDSASGSQRGIEIYTDGQTASIEMSFAPPDTLRRWFYACGSFCSGFSNGMMVWPIPMWAIEGTERIANRLKVNIITEVGGKEQ